MTDIHPRLKDPARLRQLAEEAARKNAAPLPENPETLSPDEIRKILYELHVRQIQLEMQNEELRRTQENLNESRERYFNLYNMAPVGYITLSEKGLILEANLTAASLLGVTRIALVKQPLNRFILDQDQDRYYLRQNRLFKLHEPQNYELRMLGKDGQVFWALLMATVMQNADVAQGVVACHLMLSDITERRQAEEKIQALNAELEKESMIDHLTNIFNRRYFIRRGTEEINRAIRNNFPLALLMLDIDEFKKINDTLGHAAGDLVIQQVAEALKGNLREVDILARLGGDEFTILLPNTPLQIAAVMAERVRLSIAGMVFDSPGGVQQKKLTISIGASAFTEDMTGIDDLLRKADAAMYHAKNNGRNCIKVYSADIDAPLA